MTAPRLRALLASLPIVVVAAAVTVPTVIALQSRASAEAQLRRAAHDRAALAATLIDDLILGAPRTGLQGDPAQVAATMTTVNRLAPGSPIVAMVGSSGRLLATAPSLATSARRLAATPGVAVALRTGRRQLSGLLPGVGSLPPGFEEVTPYRTASGTRALVARLAQPTVDAILDRYLASVAHFSTHAAQTRAWLVDGRGAVIAAGAPGTRPRPEGGRLFTTRALVPGTPWRVVYQLPAAALYAQVGSAFSLSLALLGGLLLAGLICLGLLARLISSLRDVHRANLVLAQRNADVERATDAKSRFLASLSHELRTPLNAVIGFSELMRDGRAGPLNDTQREYLDIVLGSAQHQVTLIEDVLDLARVESGHLRLDPRPIDPIAVARECARSLLRLAEQREIMLELSTTPVGICRLDDARLRQVILNFLSNAVKFTPHGGCVTIALDRADDCLIVRVSDTGRGIDPADQERVFGEFVQLGAPRGGGSGLGLAVTKLLVEAQGGEVGVSSEPGRGSTFWARLPAPRCAGESGDTAVAAGYRNGASDLDGHSPEESDRSSAAGSLSRRPLTRA